MKTRNLFATAALAALCSVGTAVTVAVPGDAATLSAAVALTNADAVGPNVINISAASMTDGTQVVITQPVTINGDANSDGACDILVDSVTIEGAADAGFAGQKNYIEVNTAGTVEINDLLLHPNKQGGTTAATIINAVAFFKPGSGTGNYTMNRVFAGPSNATTNAYLDPTSTADIYTAPKKWYGYLGANGVFVVSNNGGAGNYNATLNDCRAAGARSHVLNIQNQSGTTTVNGGVYSWAGSDAIHINGATGVTLTGTDSNRIRVYQANRSSGGEGVRVTGNTAVVNLMEYVDSFTHVTSAFAFYGGTVTTARNLRANVSGGTTFWMQGNAVATVSDSTFHRVGANPAGVAAAHTGTASFTDVIFTSTATGQVALAATAPSSNYLLTNCALPTDGAAGESLNITTPTTGAFNTIADSVTASPDYMATAFVVGNAENYTVLRPGNSAAYTGAASDNSNFVGGAGGTEVPVTMSGFSID